MEILEAHSLTLDQKRVVMELWNKEYPRGLAHKSIESFEGYLGSLSEPTFLLALENDTVVGWAALFAREAQWWFAIILDETQQGKGLGTRLLSLLKEKTTLLYGWVIDSHTEIRKDGSLYRSPLEFYRKNWFFVLEDQRLELENLSAVKIRWELEN